MACCLNNNLNPLHLGLHIWFCIYYLCSECHHLPLFSFEPFPLLVSPLTWVCNGIREQGALSVDLLVSVTDPAPFRIIIGQDELRHDTMDWLYHLSVKTAFPPPHRASGEGCVPWRNCFRQAHVPRSFINAKLKYFSNFKKIFKLLIQ